MSDTEMRRGAGLASLAFALISFAADAADVYRWVDAEGGIHYSDQAVAGARKLRVTAPAAALPPALPADPEACAALESQLQQYREAPAIFEEDALGNRRSLDGDQRQQLLARTQQRRDRACRPSE